MYIVTGGAGFIGSALIAKLNAEGIENILVVDEVGASEKWRNLRNKFFLDYLHKDAFIKIIRQGQIPAAWGALEGIVHMGACSATTEDDFDFLAENNFHYSQELAQFCLQTCVRFIYASSAATYGDGSSGYSDDPSAVRKLRPLNRYGYSKQLFDQWALRQGLLERIVGLKFFNVFGPNEYHKGSMISVVNQAYHQIRETGVCQLFKSYRPEFKDGEQKRDFIYVKDCCEVMWWLLNTPKVNGLFNLGTGTARSWNDLAWSVFVGLNRPSNIEYVEMPEKLRSQYQYFTQADMRRLKATGCPVEFTQLESAVRDYIVNYLSKADPYL